MYFLINFLWEFKKFEWQDDKWDENKVNYMLPINDKPTFSTYNFSTILVKIGHYTVKSWYT